MIESGVIEALLPHEQQMVRHSLRTLASLGLIQQQLELNLVRLTNQVATLNDEESLGAIREYNRTKDLLKSFQHLCESEGE